MKNLISLLIVVFCLVHHSPAQNVSNCSIEEFALLQDKPAELQNMAALNVIQGRSEYASLRNIGRKFYHVQTFPYPKDSATSYEKGWVVVGNTGNRHWESRTIISGTEAPSINRTLLFFLAITLFCGI